MLPILLIGFWLRIHQLSSYPTGVSNDEGINVIDILHVMRSGNFPLYEDLGRPEPLYRILQAVSNKFYGLSVWSARLTTSFFGLLTLAAAYWATTECLRDVPRDYRRVAALAAVIALTIAIGHITLSRSLYRAMLQPLFMLLTTGFLMRGLHKYRWRDFLCAGVFMALALYSYTAAYFVPLALVPVFISLAIFRRNTWRFWLPRLFVMGVVVGVLMLPVALRFLNTPSAVLGRASEVSKPNLQPLYLIGKFGGLFLADGDINPQYNAAHAPLVPTFFTWIFVAGLFAVLLRIRQTSSAYLAALLVLCAMPVLLSNEIPHGLRIMGEYAVFPLIIGLAVSSILVLLARITSKRVLITASILILTGILGTQSVLAWGIYTNYWDHADNFYIWRIFGYALNHNEWFFRTDRRAFANWIKAQNHPLLIPLDELTRITTRTWLVDKYPNVKPIQAITSLPADTTIVVPWSLESSSLMLETHDYVLLQGDTINLLPSFSQATQNALTANIETGEHLSYEDQQLSFLGYAKPVPQGTVLTYEDTVSRPATTFSDQLQLASVQ
ncbi:MAG: glycosyltransferase family 39 protein, partial [Chloroflexota bacterium]